MMNKGILYDLSVVEIKNTLPIDRYRGRFMIYLSMSLIVTAFVFVSVSIETIESELIKTTRIINGKNCIVIEKDRGQGKVMVKPESESIYYKNVDDVEFKILNGVILCDSCELTNIGERFVAFQVSGNFELNLRDSKIYSIKVISKKPLWTLLIK